MLDNLFRSLPPIDLFSFLLGLVLGTLLCLAILRYGKQRIQAKMFGKKRAPLKVIRSADKALDHFQLEEYKRAQSDHLLGTLCPLDDVYVHLPLIYPYPYIDPQNKPADDYEASSLLPFLPELPEFYESAPFRSCSLFTALVNHRRILIQGDLGTGKTTLCNYAISNILKKTENSLALHEAIPFYVHYSEIDLHAIDKDQPESILYETRAFRSLNLSSQALQARFRPLLAEGKAILFFDGLDEISAAICQEYIDWLKSLVATLPAIRLVVTGNLSFTSDLLQQSFAPYFISPLTIGAKKELVTKMSAKLGQLQIWSGSSSVNSFESSSWRRQKNSLTNVSTFVLSLLAGLTCSGASENTPALYANYISRFCLQQEQLENLAKCAQLMSKSETHTLHKDKLSGLLRNVDAQIEQKDLQVTESSFSSFLIEAGLLVERQQGYYGFSFAPLYAYLLRHDIGQENLENWKRFYYDPCENLALALSSETSYLATWLAVQDSPLARNVSLLTVHFEKLRSNSVLQNQFFPRILATLQQNRLSIPIKLKYLALLLRLDEENLAKVLEHMHQKFTGERLFSILGFGFLETSKSLAYLKATLSNGTPLEKAYCALSLARMSLPEARQTLITSLQSNDDLYCRLVSEMLALDTAEGHLQLKELAQSANIAVRKSSLYGIKLIREPWVTDYLTNLSTGDKEWIVRDTAAAALEEILTHRIELANLEAPELDKIEWLAHIAEQKGRKLSAEEPPIDLLDELMHRGDVHEKNASLFLLSRYPSKEIRDLLSAQFARETELSDQAFFFVSEIARREQIT
jgi:hypothetical protein